MSHVTLITPPRPPLTLRGGGLLTSDDLHLFNEGRHFRLYEKLGAHILSGSGVRDPKYGKPFSDPGVRIPDPVTSFAVWAPNAVEVSVIGDFNGWKPGQHPLTPREQSGIWEGVFAVLGEGTLYKYHIRSRINDTCFEKTDPFAFRTEIPPRTASVVSALDYRWRDDAWMKKRATHNSLAAPISIYEMHLGSWQRVPEEGNRPLTYREIAPKLIAYVQEMGFTHVEFLPIMEHPFGGSWGYQLSNYFAPTARYGTPQDLMFLIDELHRHDIGVILDWVPSHFPCDPHGLGMFDGTHLYEHADPRRGFHPDWGSAIFNYGRNEVRSFLISNALFWFDRYHVDGLRVDAVASMLYLDYSRKVGEWIPNARGGRENDDAVAFLRQLNETVYLHYPDVQMIAEESTAWSMVSRPTSWGGLGFGLKWDMGWMHDTLHYIGHDPIHRRYHQNELTFRMIYAFTENFVLPLSHDEVVHGKGSLLGKMPGDEWQQFANLRLLLGTMFAMPGKKLLFMGGEFGQRDEWHHDRSLDWHLLKEGKHLGVQRWMKNLNHLYRSEPALHQFDCSPGGFEWIDGSDIDNSVVSFIRRGASARDTVVVVCNLTPIPRQSYRVGVPQGGFWKEILNSDADVYGGSGWGNFGGVATDPVPFHARPASLNLSLPPLSVLFLTPQQR